MNKTEIDLYKDSIGKVQYIQHVGSCKTIVNSARVSFGQDNDKGLTKRDEKLIRYLIKHKHVSTLEHNMLTVIVLGTSTKLAADTLMLTFSFMSLINFAHNTNLIGRLRTQKN